MMGREHIRNISLIPNTSVIGIYEPNQEMCRLARNLAPDAHFFGTLKELLKEAEFDCLVIATPNFQHIADLFEILKSFADASKTVDFIGRAPNRGQKRTPWVDFLLTDKANTGVRWVHVTTRNETPRKSSPTPINTCKR